ncbi:MAG: recombinase [Bacteroidota bacterium]|nr:recombinase [Bacteroidota bacterium]
MNSLWIFIIIVVICIALSSKPATPDPKAEAFASAGDFLNTRNCGFALFGGKRAISIELSTRNSLIVGSSGSGKSSTVLYGTIQSLARGPVSIALNDINSESYSRTSGYLAHRGMEIYNIDYSPLSDGFNPLELCKTPSDVMRVMHVLVSNASVISKNDPYWSTACEGLLSTFGEYLCFYAQPEHRTFYNLYRMLEVFAGTPTTIDKLFVKADKKLLDSYKAIVRTPERTRQSILATALAATQIFKDPSVARTTSKNTIDFSTFRTIKSIVYLGTPLNQVSYLAQISALLFTTIFNEILSRIPEDNENYMFCLLDELLTMKLDLGLVYSQIRKHRGGCISFIQSLPMLEMNWSPAEARAIRDNSYSTVFLPGQSISTARELHDIIGKYSVSEDANRPSRRTVFEASEIRQLDQAIALVGNEKPIMEPLVPYYEHFEFNQRSKLPPFTRIQKLPTGDLPIIC